MEAGSLAVLLPELEAFLCKFDDCFVRREQHAHLRLYVRGQLSDLPRKSIEPMALAGDVPPRTLQQFLSLHGWDDGMLRDRVQQVIGREHDDPDAIDLLDETYHAKKGDKTPGVQRQWCGTKGTTDNCAVTVHLARAGSADGGGKTFRCLLDSELFLPESWSSDRGRCEEAGIPDDMVYRPKKQIALEMLDRARRNGVRIGWLTFDAGYGMHTDFLLELDARQIQYVGEAPCHLTGWIKPPPVLIKEHPPNRRRGDKFGRPKLFPRAKVLPGDMHKAKSVENLVRHSPAFTSQEWTRFHVKDDDAGPVVWEVKAAPFHLKNDRVPTWAHWLIAARHTLTGEVKYFVSNAPSGTPLEQLLRVAFNRWPVERCFQDAKSELGLSHFEVRNYRSLLRHMILTSVSLLFLSRATAALRGKKTARHGLPGATGPHGADTRILGRRAHQPQKA
jgi:SRSO17 transposase